MITVTDLFCGAGGSSSGATVIPGVRVRMAANHWKLAIETHNTNHPDTDHDCADISQVDPRRYPRTDILWGSPECFTRGHLVTTARGQVPIEDVQVGDLALTHLGRWRPVVRTQQRQADTVIVKGQGHAGIEVTPNHRFWCIPSGHVWQQGLRQYRREYSEPQWIAADSTLTVEALWATPTRIAPLPVDQPPAAFGVDLTAAWWLVGRWVGDGSLAFGRNHEVSICCGFHEADELRELLADTGQDWSMRNLRTAVLFTTSDLKAREWLHEHFGHGAAAKGLPSFAFTMPRAHRAALLEGYLSADGGTTQRRIRVSTVSHRLAVSARILAETLGHRVAVGIDKRTTYAIEGRTGVALPQWILHWEPNLAGHRAPEAFDDGMHAWSRIRSVTPGREDVTVYNIEVDEDHSYVLDGIVVANCTNHSQAKGNRRIANPGPDLFGESLPDEAADRSRATMWDVVRFAEHHRYRAVIVENVVDAYHWAPFRAWLMAMDCLGYEHQIVWLNSMHAQAAGLPAPQSRDRMYVVFHQRGERRPDVTRWTRPKAWCPTCEATVSAVQAFKRTDRPAWGRYRAQYVYRCPNMACRNSVVEPGWLPAASAIDWSMPGERIGDRARPLAPKTRARIEAGLRKYARPVHLEAAGNTFERPGYVRAWPVDQPFKTLHTTASKGVAVPPFITINREGQRNRGVDEPVPTIVASPNPMGLVVPAGGTWNDDARSTDDPMRTRTTRETDALVIPLRAGNAAKPAHVVLDTVATRSQHALVMRNNTGGAEMCTPVGEVLRTMTTAGHQSLIRWGHMVVDYNGPARSVGDPLPTQTTVEGDGLASIAVDVDDCLFRMLEPHEIAAAMAFPITYVLLGNKRERVKLCGNAVTPPAARDLIAAVVEALTGETPELVA